MGYSYTILKRDGQNKYIQTTDAYRPVKAIWYYIYIWYDGEIETTPNGQNAYHKEPTENLL